MLFLKARDEALQIYGNPRLCAPRRRTQILHGPCDWLIEFSSRARVNIRLTSGQGRS